MSVATSLPDYDSVGHNDRVTFWQALKAINRRLPAPAQRLAGAALRFVGVQPPRTTDDIASDWASRKDKEWLTFYRESWDRPYRRVLVNHVARFHPASVLELGCHAGPNLRLLAERFPNAQITGVDVNLPAVEEAQRSLATFPNVTVEHADLRAALAGLTDDGVDCIVSCFALALVAPEDIGDVLGQAWRAARKAVILMEPVPADNEVVGMSGWRHDYAAIMVTAGAHTELLPPEQREGELNAVTVAEKRAR